MEYTDVDRRRASDVNLGRFLMDFVMMVGRGGVVWFGGGRKEEKMVNGRG